jgi:fructokinase
MDPLLLGRRAEDGFAEVLDDNLRASGLGLEGLIDADGVSMLAVCSPDAAGSMSYAFYTSDSPDLRWTAADLDLARSLMVAKGVVAWHTGSLVSYLGAGTAPLFHAWQQARSDDRVTLSYDPNARPHALAAPATREQVERFALTAHVVKASEEDLAYCYPELTAEQVCARWVETGPTIVVLTRGAGGATVWQRGHAPIDIAAPAVTVVDTVAAGDTLMAGLLAGLADWFGPDSESRLCQIDSRELVERVKRAVWAAALTCTRAGAQPPTLTELDAFLAKSG